MRPPFIHPKRFPLRNKSDNARTKSFWRGAERRVANWTTGFKPNGNFKPAKILFPPIEAEAWVLEGTQDEQAAEAFAQRKQNFKTIVNFMNSTLDAVMERPARSPYSAKRMAKPINFYCHARPDAKSVRLVGDFNNWDMASLPMQRQPDGCWFVQVPLTHGHHQYQFVVDGLAALDPHASGVARTERNGQVSIIAVS